MSTYYLFYVVGFTTIAIHELLWAPKYNIKRGFAIIHLIPCCITEFLLMLLLFYIVNGRFGGQNMVRIFIFIPLITYFYGKILKMPMDRLMDFTAPLPCIVLGFAKIGCLLTGCCESWLCVDWGIYNSHAKATLFPVQLFESATCFMIVLIVLIIAKKYNYNAQGRTMPIMLFLFGITRYGWEFLRDNTKLFWGISEMALWALASAVMGIAWLVWLEHKSRKGANEEQNCIEDSDDIAECKN